MVAGAEQDEVVEVCGATVDPVLAVVGVEPAGAVAAGGPAVPVPVLEEPEHVGGDGAGAAAEPDRHPPGVFDDDLADRVTRDASRGLVRDRDAFVTRVQVRAGCIGIFEVCGFGGVDQHRRSVGFGVGGEVLSERVDQDIGAPDRERVPGAVLVRTGLFRARG